MPRRPADTCVAHGHGRVAALVDDLRIETARERVAGYRDAMGTARASRSTSSRHTELRTQHEAEAS